MRDKADMREIEFSPVPVGRRSSVLSAILNEHEPMFPDVKLSVIMPAYNEAERIFSSVVKTSEALEGLDYEIVVVDDGSADDTHQEALRAAHLLNSSGDGGERTMVMEKAQRANFGALVVEARPRSSHLAGGQRVKVVRYEANQGKGYALRFGFSHSVGDVVAFFDADLDLPPFQIRSLCCEMLETGADVVIGSKKHPESKLDYPPLRKLISFGYYALVRLLFSLPIHDSQTGLKLFRREVLERVLPRMKVQRFAHDLELLVGAHRFGYRIGESPVHITFGRTKNGPIMLARASVNVWLDTLRVFYWSSFWNWLKPGVVTRLWIIALFFGVSSLSFGAAGFLNRLGVPAWFEEVARIVFVQFVAQPVRDAFLLLIGIVIVCAACLELNKRVSDAFARPDEGGLADIVNTNYSSSSEGNESAGKADSD